MICENLTPWDLGLYNREKFAIAIVLYCLNYKKIASFTGKLHKVIKVIKIVMKNW